MEVTMQAWRNRADQLAIYFSGLPDYLMLDGIEYDTSSVFSAWEHLMIVGRLADATILEVLIGRHPDTMCKFELGVSGTEYDRIPTPRLRIVAILRDIAEGKRDPDYMNGLHS